MTCAGSSRQAAATMFLGNNARTDKALTRHVLYSRSGLKRTAWAAFPAQAISKPAIHAESEHQLQAKLDLPGLSVRAQNAGRTNYGSRSASKDLREAGSRHAEVRAIQNVEKLRAELQISTIPQELEGGVLDQREIQICQSRRSQDIAPRRAQVAC